MHPTMKFISSQSRSIRVHPWLGILPPIKAKRPPQPAEGACAKVHRLLYLVAFSTALETALAAFVARFSRVVLLVPAATVVAVLVFFTGGRALSLSSVVSMFRRSLLLERA